jgi:hypothetical protein
VERPTDPDTPRLPNISDWHLDFHVPATAH